MIEIKRSIEHWVSDEEIKSALDIDNEFMARLSNNLECARIMFDMDGYKKDYPNLDPGSKIPAHITGRYGGEYYWRPRLGIYHQCKEIHPCDLAYYESSIDHIEPKKHLLWVRSDNFQCVVDLSFFTGSLYFRAYSWEVIR